MNSRERDLRTKKEAEDDPNYSSKIRASSRQWSSHKNPRIVRVSRSFGGKDRHSKVCTVRGLRDRRIRLSVPTAVQLYDLQDRLGVGQPSKVVDWLLDATKNDIDKLPPLPMLPGIESPAAGHQNPKYLGLNNPAREGNIVQENQEGFVLSQNQLFNQFSFPNMPYNNNSYSNYFHNWDPPSLSLSHIGGYPLPNQSEDQSHNNLSTVLPSNSQLYFRPSATTIPSIIPSFPSYINPIMESDWRQLNSLQNPILPTTLHLISPSFTLNSNSKSLHLQQNDNERREKN